MLTGSTSDCDSDRVGSNPAIDFPFKVDHSNWCSGNTARFHRATKGSIPLFECANVYLKFYSKIIHYDTDILIYLLKNNYKKRFLMVNICN